MYETENYRKTLEAFIDLMRIRNDENQLKRIPMEAENLLNLIRQGKYQIQEIKLPPFKRLNENQHGSKRIQG